MGEVDAELQFKVSKLTLVSELAQIASKAPGRHYNEDHEEVFLEMDEDVLRVMDQLEKYVYYNTSWYADID